MHRLSIEINNSKIKTTFCSCDLRFIPPRRSEPHIYIYVFVFFVFLLNNTYPHFPFPLLFFFFFYLIETTLLVDGTSLLPEGTRAK